MDIEFAPVANAKKRYKLGNGRYRCSRCKYSFREFSGRWINHGRLSCIQWLSILKLFELEVSIHKMARQMKMSYKAVCGAVNTIRMSILSHAEDAKDYLGGEIDLMRPTSAEEENATGEEAPPTRCLSLASWRGTTWSM